jgi:hypothetical protein
MPKSHPRVDLEETRRLRRSGRLEPQPEPLSRPQHHRRVADGLGRTEEHHGLGRSGQRADSVEKALLEPCRHRTSGRDAEAAGQLTGRRSTRKLQQCQWVAASFGHDPVDYVVVEAPVDHRGEQAPGLVIGQTADYQLRQAGEGLILRRFAHREYERDRFAQQPSCNERQGLSRRSVEPLGVVDQAHQWTGFRDLGEQLKRGKANEKQVGRRAGPPTEGDFDRLPLGTGEVFQRSEHRSEKLLKRGKGEFRLSLRAGNVSQLASRRALSQILEQRRLPDPGLSAQHQRSASARPCARQQLAQYLLLAFATEQVVPLAGMPLGSRIALPEGDSECGSGFDHEFRHRQSRQPGFIASPDA